MNITRLTTISKKNLLEIDAAFKAADYLESKTQRFESSVDLHEKITGYLQVLHTSYAARLGRLQKGNTLIYKTPDLYTVKGYVNLLATYAMSRDETKNTRQLQARDKINAVFDLAIERIHWLEEK